MNNRRRRIAKRVRKAGGVRLSRYARLSLKYDEQEIRFPMRYRR